MEQVLGERRKKLCVEHDRPLGLAEQCDIIGISAEAFDVALHPLQRRLLTEEGVVSGAFVVTGCGQAGKCQESQGAETVVDGPHDDVTLTDDLRRVVLLGIPIASRAAMHSHHHREGAIHGGMCIDIDDEAVFIRAWAAEKVSLRAGIDGFGCLERLRLGFARLPQPEPVGSARRRSVGNAQVLGFAGTGNADHGAVVRLDLRCGGVRCRTIFRPHRYDQESRRDSNHRD